MHIYVVRMHALIHMCRVLHNNFFFKKNSLRFRQRASKIFNDEMTRKITPSNPNWLGFLNILRDLESQDRKGIWGRQIGHGK